MSRSMDDGLALQGHTATLLVREVNYSGDMTALADACGMFGLVCFVLLLCSLTAYVALPLWRTKGVRGLKDDGVVDKKGEKSPAHVSGASPKPSLGTLQHGVTHLAVIMDGNRRYGKRECAEAQRKGRPTTETHHTEAIRHLCRELCYDDAPLDTSQVCPVPIACDSDIDPHPSRSWLKDRYRYFTSLIQSTRLDGHRLGGEKLIEFIRYCLEAKIDMLTVYAFSTDNWNRPAHEVDALMTLFFFFFDRIRQTARQDGIFIRFVSTNTELLPPRIMALMQVVESESRSFSPRRITVNVCVSYGGQQEILGACNRILAARWQSAARTSQTTQCPITQQELGAEMLRSVTQCDHEEEDGARVFSARVPREPQLLLRTSGEQRISNFLLYESAYSEFVFTGRTWPEITRQDLHDALSQFRSRERRGGK